MKRSLNSKTIVWILLCMYFVLAFCTYPDSIPQRGFLMTGIIILSALLLRPGFVIHIKKYPITNVLITIIILDSVSNILSGTNAINHTVYAVQYVFLIICIIAIVEKRDEYYSLMKVMFWTSFIGGPLIGIYQMINGGYLFGSNDNLDPFFKAIISTVGHTNSNYTAICMLFCVLLSGALAFKTDYNSYKICCVISCVCVVLTYSRTSIAALLFCLLCFFIFEKSDNNPKKISVRNIVIVFFGVIIIVSLYQKFFDLAQAYLSGADLNRLFYIKQSSTSDMRFDQWKASIEVVFSKGPLEFFFGFGENAAMEMGKITGRAMSAHNFFFGRLSENGLVGFFSAILLYVRSISAFFKSRKSLDQSNKWVSYIAMTILICYLMISNMTWELICTLVIFELLLSKKLYVSEVKDNG